MASVKSGATYLNNCIQTYASPRWYLKQTDWPCTAGSTIICSYWRLSLQLFSIDLFHQLLNHYISSHHFFHWQINPYCSQSFSLTSRFYQPIKPRSIYLWWRNVVSHKTFRLKFQQARCHVDGEQLLHCVCHCHCDCTRNCPCFYWHHRNDRLDR